MNKNERPKIDGLFDILHLEDYEGLLVEDKITGYKTYKKKTPNGKIILRKGYYYIYEEYFDNLNYHIAKAYDAKTLKVKQKTLFADRKETNIILGKEYFYDNNATLLRVVDHDKGWDFSYEDVINYLYDNIEDKISLETLSISKESFKGRNYWEIETNISFWENNHFLRIDGNTGEVLCHIIIYEEEGGSYTKVLKTIVPNKIDKLPPEQSKYQDWRDENGKKYKTPDTRRKVNGISYTEEEWKAYEEEQWEKYQTNRNHKSFWDKLFG
ncbi:hypothetical protein [Capnocytophaga genosp. AHN8471]|uniref:hypothetical protein n=1 Tax=Capnocytophaga genosp. AHN8471 TaxID=327574 RepID=UPI001EE4CEDF|nr:hypothetical protein [Capnocytophaga genosp. AHN8471]